MKRKQKITGKELEEMTVRGLAKQNRKENIYVYLSMAGGLIFGVLLLYLVLPSKIHDQYWLGGFMLIGFLLGAVFYAKVIMKNSLQRSMAAIEREFENGLTSPRKKQYAKKK